MNREAVIRAAFFMAKALGQRTSRREVNAVIAKQLGKGFRTAEVAAVLSKLREPLRNQHGTSKEPASVLKTCTLGTSREPPGNPLPLLHVQDNLDSELRSSSRNGKPSPVAANGRAKRVTQLPLDRALLDSKNAILKAVWNELQPFIGRSSTWTDWRARNSVVAASFAKLGFTPEQIVAAWKHASDRKGEPLRELFMVQKAMDAVALFKAMEARA